MTYQLLLADDSATMQKVVQITFDREDFKVTAVSNGEEALRAARELKPHVMLVDVRMPGLDGYQVCDTLKKDPSTAGIQICLLGGTIEPFDEARAKASGADGHVIKPFETQVLIDRVKTLVGAPVTAAAGMPAAGAVPPPATVAPPAAARPAAPAPAPAAFAPPPAAAPRPAAPPPAAAVPPPAARPSGVPPPPAAPPRPAAPPPAAQ